MENLLFYLMAAAAVGGALGVVLARNPVGNVLALLLCFFSLATIYLLAGFQFLAAAQILVYAGAILVLFLFVIMLLNLGSAGPLPKIDRAMFVRRRSTLAIAVAGALLLALALPLANVPESPATPLPEHGLDPSLALAESLFGPYALPFEATSLLLLATAVGVLVLAKRGNRGEVAVTVPNSHLLLLAAVLFAIGVAGFLLRRNVIVVLMSIELMLNAANLSFLAGSRMHALASPNPVPDAQGPVFAIFVIVVAAVEAAIGLALVIALFRHKQSVSLDEVHELGGLTLDTPGLWLLPAAPLLGSILCGILHFAGRGSKSPAAHKLAGGIAVLAMAAAFGLSLIGFQDLRELPADARVLASPAWHWISTGTFRIDVGLVLDPLSSVMTLVITGVGFLIHVYAIGYMKGDAGYARFFAYLNLFVFAMLLLVLASSLPGLFVGWEGVGLCSYLLIGFWYEKSFAAEAGQKAFVMNRIGDAGFLLGTFLIAKTLGTLDIRAILAADVAGVSGELSLAALLLFAGACGKSAQIPLFTWLPDAMAGPTPVSALIHAATMVTAGVYLLVRLSPIYVLSPALMLLVASIGAATALVAGSSALCQRDIKKVLAYSTVSQLGYMFLALGSGAFAAAIFHLVTHAFFKALLFLGAGSVIHGMHEEQDMHRMGGLARKMPHTFATFLAGAAALSGLPLTSGFFSKDEILAAACANGGPYWVLWVAGLVAAGLTAFYTWRMVALTFFGRERFDTAHVHPHESPAVMVGPLWILAVLAIVGGALGLPAVSHVPHLLAEWLAPIVEPAEHRFAELRGGTAHLSHALEWSLLGLGALIALVFAQRGLKTSESGPEFDERFVRARPALAAFLADAWGLDRFYRRCVVQPIALLGFAIAVIVDQFAIDGLVDGAASLARSLGARSRSMASGQIAAYGLWMGAAAVAIAGFFLLRGAS